MSNILLLTDVPPCKDFSGAMLTYSMANYLSDDSISCIVVLNPSLSFLKNSESILSIPIYYLDKPKEQVKLTRNPYVNMVLSFFQETKNDFFELNRIEKYVTDYVRRNNVKKIWCILQGQTMIKLAYQLINNSNVPLYAQIWDHPKWWIRANNIDPISSRHILKKYNKVLISSRFVGTASFGMSKEINDLQKNNIPLIASLNDSQSFPVKSNSNNGIYRIGVAGQLYANTEWQVLLEVLDQLQWKINNIDISIRYLGYNSISVGHKIANIEYLGYRSQNETIRLMSECDILYCPYFFSNEYEIIARTSFPSKLTTYLAAGRPVLFHGPEYSSPSVFLKENNAALFCHSFVKEEIAYALHTLFSNQELRKSIAENGRQAFLKYLTTEKLRENFAKFLQLDTNELIIN